MTQRYFEFDILRVSAILYIILVRHIDDYASDIYQSQTVKDFTYISLGVLVFISGFLLVKTSNGMKTLPDLKHFIYHKMIRIYPLYAFALLCYFFLSIINDDKLISGMLLYSIFIGDYILTLWFIPMIIFYYFIYMLIDFRFQKKRFLYISIAVYFLLIFEMKLLNSFQYQLLLYYPIFITGFIAAKYNIINKIDLNICCLAMIVFLLVLFFKKFVPDNVDLIMIDLLILSFSIVSMYLLHLIELNQGSDNSFQSHFLKILFSIIINISYASFCMYLLHRIVFELFLKIYKPATTFCTLLYLYIFAVPIIYLFSIYLQTYYDKYFLRIGLYRKKAPF